jgi:hypothetical protein
LGWKKCAKICGVNQIERNVPWNQRKVLKSLFFLSSSFLGFFFSAELSLVSRASSGRTY